MGGCRSQQHLTRWREFKMSSVNEVMSDLEEEIRFLEFDKTHRTLKDIIDDILDEDKKKKRRIGEG